MWRARFIGWSFELDRIGRALAIAREELAFRTFTEQDWLELSRVLYARAPQYPPGTKHNESGLFAFEREAIERFFPPAPASIIVGACGGGRELFALMARGYRIAAAYDPVASFIDGLRADPRLAEAKERICVGSHQAFDVITRLAAPQHDRSTIDAVVVGWGSYTHIIGASHRVQFLRSLRARCPRAPVLISFFIQLGDEVDRRRRWRSQLRRILGTTVEMVEIGDGLHRGAGGVHCFTEASFRSEAAQGGYRVKHWQEHDFAAAHAVLVPEEPGGSP